MSTRTLAVLLAAGLAITACQGQTAPTLTDPDEILAAAVRTTAEQTAVRIDGTVDGAVALDLFGTGGGAPIELTGSTVTADLDLERGAAKATFTVAAFNITGELIAVDGTSYLRTSLTGPDYITQPIDVPGGADPSAVPASILDSLGEVLTQPGLDPVKGEDVPCGSATCYTVELTLTADQLAALGADLEIPSGLPLPIPDLSGATVDLVVHVTKDTTQLAGLAAALDGGPAGEVDLDLTFSKWSEPVTIEAPATNEVAPAG